MGSIVVTLLPLPISLLQSPTRWTGLIHGNISITAMLFSVRSVGFLLCSIHRER